MGTPKITGFLIALTIISFISVAFGLLISNMATNYNIDYDNSTIAAYNKMDDLALKSEGFKNETSSIREKSGVLDIVGGFFSDAYSVLLITKDSFDIYDSMLNQGIDDLNLGQIGNILKTMLGVIVIILIFIGIIIAAIVKRDL
jgi:hypothetical protein